MGAEGALHREPVDDLGTGPAFRGAQHNRRPRDATHVLAAPRRRLDLSNPLVAAIERVRELLVHGAGVVATDDMHLVSVRAEEAAEVLLASATEHRGAADLVSVQLQNREYRAVAPRIQEAHAFPRSLERPGLRFAVADDARRDQVGIVENRAERVRERVSQLTTLVDGAGRRDAHVAGDAAWRRELTYEPEQAGLVERDRRVDLRIGSLEVDVGHDGRAAVARAGDVEDVTIALLYQAVELDVDEAQSRRGAPVTEQSRFDVLHAQRFAQQRVCLEVDLRDGQIVRGGPGGDQRIHVDGGGGRSHCAHHRHRSRGGRLA